MSREYPIRELCAALEVAGSPYLGKDAGEALGSACGVAISADYAAGIAASDCLIDFTRPEGSLLHLDACVKAGTNMVIGTTGFSAEGKQRIVDAAKRVGAAIAKLARERDIREVSFNRNGFVYTGRVKALADAAREAGLSF